MAVKKKATKAAKIEAATAATDNGARPKELTDAWVHKHYGDYQRALVALREQMALVPPVDAAALSRYSRKSIAAAARVRRSEAKEYRAQQRSERKKQRLAARREKLMAALKEAESELATL